MLNSADHWGKMVVSLVVSFLVSLSITLNYLISLFIAGSTFIHLCIVLFCFAKKIDKSKIFCFDNLSELHRRVLNTKNRIFFIYIFLFSCLFSMFFVWIPEHLNNDFFVLQFLLVIILLLICFLYLVFLKMKNFMKINILKNKYIQLNIYEIVSLIFILILFTLIFCLCLCYHVFGDKLHASSESFNYIISFVSGVFSVKNNVDRGQLYGSLILFVILFLAINVGLVYFSKALLGVFYFVYYGKPNEFDQGNQDVKTLSNAINSLSLIDIFLFSVFFVFVASVLVCYMCSILFQFMDIDNSEMTVHNNKFNLYFFYHWGVMVSKEFVSYDQIKGINKNTNQLEVFIRFSSFLAWACMQVFMAGIIAGFFSKILNLNSEKKFHRLSFKRKNPTDVQKNNDIPKDLKQAETRSIKSGLNRATWLLAIIIILQLLVVLKGFIH